MAEVDPTKCIGDRICERVCPTGAIRVVEKKAVVDGKKCASCFKCMDYCEEEAISVVPRAEPVILRVDPSGVDPDELQALCGKAHLRPEDVICPCTLTRADEVAAAILMGARSPEDLSVMTGVRTACGMWCMSLILELLRAHGIDTTPPKGASWYDVDAALWNLSDAVVRKYPEFRLEEARRRLEEGLEVPAPGPEN